MKAKSTKNNNTHMTFEEERRFQHDFKVIAKATGQNPNPDRGDYDYRSAWKVGHRRLDDLAKSTTTGKYEWPTEFSRRVGMKASRVPW
jgi:hypothetical protein